MDCIMDCIMDVVMDCMMDCMMDCIMDCTMDCTMDCMMDCTMDCICQSSLLVNVQYLSMRMINYLFIFSIETQNTKKPVQVGTERKKKDRLKGKTPANRRPITVDE